jgi:hypothetical protein
VDPIPRKDLLWRPTVAPPTASKVKCQKGIFKEKVMTAIKVVRNLLGTVGILFAGYVFLSSVKDAGRYLKMSSM